MSVDRSKSPNDKIDRAVDKLLKRLDASGDDAIDAETAVKVVNMAVAWEKVKHHIADNGGGGFDPDGI